MFLGPISSLTLVLALFGQVASIEELCDHVIPTIPCGSGCIRSDHLDGGVDCVNDQCILAEPLGEMYHVLVDIGQFTPESIVSTGCMDASNQCGETLYDPSINICVDGEIVQYQYACANGEYCPVQSLCDIKGRCWLKTLVCADMDMVCGPQNGGDLWDLYDFFEEGGGVGSGTLEDICGNPCGATEPTPAPGAETTSAVSKGGEANRVAAFLLASTGYAFAVADM